MCLCENVLKMGMLVEMIFMRGEREKGRRGVDVSFSR